MSCRIALLLIAMTCAGFVRAADPAPVDAGWLVTELGKGGYLVFFRHTSTFRDQVDMEARNVASGRLSLDDCTTQRVLNERGVIEAGRQAKIWNELAIPVGAVYASRYCRARDHVRWFSERVTWSDALTPVRNADKAKELRQMLATPPAPGSNTLFFAHGGILWQATDYDSEEAETFVFRPGSPPVLVAAIKMSDWDALAQRKGSCCAPRTYWGGQGPPKE
jgi:hypothetical protein